MAPGSSLDVRLGVDPALHDRYGQAIYQCRGGEGRFRSVMSTMTTAIALCSATMNLERRRVLMVGSIAIISAPDPLELSRGASTMESVIVVTVAMNIRAWQSHIDMQGDWACNERKIAEKARRHSERPNCQSCDTSSRPRR